MLNSTTEISTIFAMDEIYKQILTFLEQIVNELAAKVPQPKLVVTGKLRAFRYEEQTIHQAIVQKLARMVSTLAATRLLFNNGFVQEQASLQRILDEISEDIQFLAFGVLEGDHKSELHCQFLDAFYQEEFDAETAIRSSQNRQMVPRRKIQAYLTRTSFSPCDPSGGQEVLRTVSKFYSGFIHAASPQLMEMYGGEPKRFHMCGMKETLNYDDYGWDLWNYFYRGICSCALSAKAFGIEELFNECHEFEKWLQEKFPDHFPKV